MGISIAINITGDTASGAAGELRALLDRLCGARVERVKDNTALLPFVCVPYTQAQGVMTPDCYPQTEESLADSFPPEKTDEAIAKLTALDARAAEAALLKEAVVPKARRGRISNAEKALAQVAAAKANPVAASDTGNGMNLDELLGLESAQTEMFPEVQAEEQADLQVETAIEADFAIAEQQIEAAEQVVVEDAEVLAVLSDNPAPSEEIDLDALIGVEVEQPSETYVDWGKSQLFAEVAKRAKQMWGQNDSKKPLGAVWVRSFVERVKKGTLSEATEDEMRALLIKSDAGLAP